MKTFISLSTALVTLAVSGCRIAAPNISLHAGPASASAAESPLPSAAPILMTGNNYPMSPEGEGKPMEMDMKMDMKMDMRKAPEHGAQPAKTPQHEGHEKSSSKPRADDHHEHNPPKQ